MNIETLHWSLKFLPYLSPNRYGNEAFMRLATIKESEVNPVDFDKMMEITGYTFGMTICLIVLAGMTVIIFLASVLIVYWRNKAFH